LIDSLKNIFRIPDLRSRVLFTLAMLAVYRLGNHVPTPGVDARALTQFFEENRATWEQMLLYCAQQGIAHRHAAPEDIFPQGVMTKVVV